MPVAAPPLAQSAYQVRLEWDRAGLARLAPSDLVVLVDVLGLGAEVGAALENGDDGGRERSAGGSPGIAGPAARSPLLEAAAETGAVVALGGLRNAAAVARWVLAQQTDRGERTSVAVVAASADGRFAVENQLGAGAVVASLGDLGIDHCSPDAAVAGEGFRALRGAVRHLFTASGSGLALAAAGRRDEVLSAAAVDAVSLVPVLRAGVFVPDRPL